MIFLPDQEPLTHFRRALRRSDQHILDDLLAAVQRYQAAAVYASQALPVENLLLSMLIEEHKEVERLRNLVEAHQSREQNLPVLPYG